MWSYGKPRSYEERCARGKEPQKPIDMDDYEDALREAERVSARRTELRKYNANGGGYHPEDDCQSCQRRAQLERAARLDSFKPGMVVYHKSNPKIHWCVKVFSEGWCDVECVSVLSDGSVVVNERSFPHKSLVCAEQDNLSED
jgi:hypothetical protein